MARKRHGHISESVQKLSEWERQYRRMPLQRARLRMLLLLREDPQRTLAEVSELIGCSERSVSRWLKQYHAHGIRALVDAGAGEEGRSRINQHELEELRRKLRTGNVCSLNEVQQWLHDRFGVQYSLKAISNILQHRLKARRVWVIP